jgi:signal recognition particle receptor subunit beta
MMSQYNKIYKIDEKIFVKEEDDGNIEYKWRLDYKNDYSLKKLVSQLLWRLNEGNEIYGKYEAHYLLGVYDNGIPGKLTEIELNTTIEIFNKIVSKANARIVLEEYNKIDLSNIYYCVIRLKEYDETINEINIMVCGIEQVGKTTLISYLCNSNVDNGESLIREAVMYYEHEKISGNTTSIKKQILGVKNSILINYDYSNNWEEITKISDKIINIYDTPGNKKYFKNILNAICTYSIDLIFFIEDSEKDYFTQNEYFSLLKSYCEETKINIHRIISKKEIKSNNPNILYMSCVKPESSDMNKIKQILINSEKNKKNNFNKVCDIFRITNVFSMQDCNNIIEGVQVSGDLKLDNYYLIYPDLTNVPIKINTIYRKKIESLKLNENETGSISFFGNFKKDISRSCIISNSIISDDITHFYIKEEKLELQIIKKGDIQNKKNYFLINGNLIYNVNILEINSDKILIKLTNKIYLQDKLIFILPTDFKCFSEVFILHL